MQKYHYMMEHCSGKMNPANSLSQRPDFEKEVESDNKQEILLSEYLFPNSLSNQTDKPLIDAAAAMCMLNSMDTRIKKIQYKMESYVREGLKQENSPWTTNNRLIKWKDLLYIPKKQENLRRNHYSKPQSSACRTSRDQMDKRFDYNQILLAHHTKGCRMIHKKM